MKQKELILGGIKSGKSDYAIKKSENLANKIFIATAEAFDEEMKEKIALHRKFRGTDFKTIEEPLHLANGLETSVAKKPDLIIIDCLTIWLSNLLHYFSVEETDFEINAFLEVLIKEKNRVILVSNEVGFGGIDSNALTRKYTNLLGDLNQKVARIVDHVYLLVAGIAIKIK